MELAPVLAARGLTYGGVYINGPDIAAANFDFIGPDDFILVTTRPPVDDDREGARKGVPRSGSKLEGLVDQAVKRYLHKCSRSHMILEPEMAQHLSDEYEDRAEVKVRQYREPWYSEIRSVKGAFRKASALQVTPVYMIHTRIESARRPRMLAAFGMDGRATLDWCTLLRNRPELSSLVLNRSFVLAELFHRQGGAPETTGGLQTAHHREHRIVIDHTELA